VFPLADLYQKCKQYANVLNVLYRPPVFVESAIAEAQQFRDDIEAGMEHPIEEYQPQEVIWHLTIVQTTASQIHSDKFMQNLT